MALLPFFESIPLSDVLNLLSSSAPALSQSQILNTLIFVLFIPFIETIFFVSAMDFLASQWKIDISRRGFKKLGTIALIIGLSFTFMLYHITAKGITNNSALLLVFLMMTVSLVATIFFGESKQAILFHIYANGFAINLFSLII